MYKLNKRVLGGPQSRSACPGRREKYLLLPHHLKLPGHLQLAQQRHVIQIFTTIKMFNNM